MGKVYTPKTLGEEWGFTGRHVLNLIERGELKADRAKAHYLGKWNVLMLITDIKKRSNWRKNNWGGTPTHIHLPKSNHVLYVWISPDNKYTFRRYYHTSECIRDLCESRREQWDALDPITAQAVLYHLFNEPDVC